MTADTTELIVWAASQEEGACFLTLNVPLDEENSLKLEDYESKEEGSIPTFSYCASFLLV